ncbi:hypothetical protein WH47_08069 [Habropoda laboriosa]|uniref:Uncharacterized protein n=1 Tax=Habropoda laboriosa TaxID=597456 RepID=A0A0L7QPU2_9HYME|nr:hypothetical protein WH47_08069 [Habropoda laboriosa]
MFPLASWPTPFSKKTRPTVTRNVYDRARRFDTTHCPATPAASLLFISKTRNVERG